MTCNATSPSVRPFCVWMISTVPVAILFTFLQKHLIRGLTAGALRG